MRHWLLTSLILLCAGCQLGPNAPLYSPPSPTLATSGILPNPVLVPVSDRDYAWDQIVDVVDDYFKIEREERPRVQGDLLTDGRIDTYARTGSTLLEPWNRDSINLYERLESTLQSIRRRAFITVKPAEGGYLIDVAVMKELEDLQQPEHATTGAATFRYDNSIASAEDRAGRSSVNPSPEAEQAVTRPRPVGDVNFTAGWIPIGRDAALEQQIVAQLQTRVRPLAAAVQPQIYVPTPQPVQPAPYY